MAGVLEVLITSSENASTTLELLPDAAMVAPLERGLVLVPITGALTVAIGDVERGHLGFDELTSSLAAIAQAASHQSPVVYCHLEFHGGTGFHAAVGWHRGSIDFGPLFTANHRTEQLTPAYHLVDTRNQGGDMAINAALRHLGVAATEQIDEFATVGLDRHRWTEDWVPSTT